ncbi:flagellin N-terminal helical domain-containing protein [Chitinimonas koreensis]|uniref:flagellin N-terminal helical domain-containing protein n=1 Tax=Chitinimonas koreensis TaxID=356302 RepID=UPI000422AB6E|nr:flagellin [Chitinimonas koreensis]QNM98511.1 flagellin [Chitinimonas koreensis]
MQVINTNIPSLNAQRNLDTSLGSLNTSLQRLSSGLRINSAKDDAAGLAISERFTAQIRGSEQARRNANDGVSMTQVGEGALTKMGDILQRIRELSVQSANASNSASDRLALNAEVTQLTAELDRFAQQTEFNGLKLLDGTFTSSVFQIGANANQTVTATTANFRTTAYGTQQVGSITPVSSGVYSTTTTGPVTGAAVTASGTVLIRGGAASGKISVLPTDSAKDIADKINGQSQTGIRAQSRTETTLTFGATGSYTIRAYGNNATGQTVTFNITDTSTSQGLTDVVTQFNNQTSKTGVTAKLNTTGTGVILVSDTGDNISLSATSGSIAGAISGGGVALATGASGAMTIAGQVILDSDKSYTITTSGAALSTSIFGQPLAAGGQVVSQLQSVASLDITNFDNATQAIRIVDSALAVVNGQRANFGALQSRFEATIGNLQITSENLSASRSRIRDADFAAETANLTRAQILQQAGTAMLAQANAIPNQVLSLLRG